jgi:hypothetical protein
MNGGWQPTFMERVEAYLTVRTNGTSVTVLALDGAGNVVDALPMSEVQPTPGGFRIHVNGDGQPQAPWFAVAATQPALPAIAASANPIAVPDASTLGETTISLRAAHRFRTPRSESKRLPRFKPVEPRRPRPRFSFRLLHHLSRRTRHFAGAHSA